MNVKSILVLALGAVASAQTFVGFPKTLTCELRTGEGIITADDMKAAVADGIRTLSTPNAADENSKYCRSLRGIPLYAVCPSSLPRNLLDLRGANYAAIAHSRRKGYLQVRRGHQDQHRHLLRQQRRHHRLQHWIPRQMRGGVLGFDHWVFGVAVNSIHHHILKMTMS